MAPGRSNSTFSVVVWVCCAGVCVTVDKNESLLSTAGPTSDKPATATDWRVGGNVTSPTFITLPATPTVGRRTNDAGLASRQESEKPENNGDANAKNAKNNSDGNTPVREVASKRNTKGAATRESMLAPIRGVSSTTTAERLRTASTIAGTSVMLLLSLALAGALFAMVICFIHKWRENMGAGRYPRVVYSMLRQSEDEPEDVLGEILINIGLAAPGDTHPLTPSSSSASSRCCSPIPAEPEMEISDLEGTKFTTIPLKSDEAAKRLMMPETEESDEELLQ